MDRNLLKFNFYLVRIGKHAIIILVIKCCGTNDITVFALMWEYIKYNFSKVKMERQYYFMIYNISLGVRSGSSLNIWASHKLSDLSFLISKRGIIIVSTS